MDVWLAPEAAQYMKALRLTADDGGLKGFLIGHRRGGRYIVERIIPGGSSLAGMLAGFPEVESIFDNRILGFFLIAPADKDKNHLLAPSFTGRLVLEIRLGPRIRKPIRAFTVEFTGRFRLHPLPLAGPAPEE